MSLFNRPARPQQEAELSRLIEAEESRLLDFNSRLDDLERALSPR